MKVLYKEDGTLDEVQLNHEETMKTLEHLMEKMAGAPKEELGKRQPGERGKYETYVERT